MTRLPGAAALCLALAAHLAGPLAAQSPVPVRGQVFDSLAGRPLDGALVRVVGTDRSVVADEQGRFLLALPPGPYSLEFSHPAVPSWSALRHATEIRLGATAPPEVTLATASEETILDRFCQGSGSLVGGVVLDMLTRVPLARAMVTVTARVGGRTESLGRVPTSPTGDFELCLGSLPAGEVELRAALGGTRGRPVRVETGGARVVAADLNLVVSQPARVSGLLVDRETSVPVGDALVRIQGTRLAARTGDDGAFLVRGVPPGAVTITVEHIRYGERFAQVLVESGDSVHVDLELDEAAIPLAEMVVRVRGRSTDARMRGGSRWDGLDRAAIQELLETSYAFVDLLRNASLPGMQVRDDGEKLCVEAGRRTNAFGAEACLMVEVYLNDVRVANPAQVLRSFPYESIDRLRLLTGMEAASRYGGAAAKNGVLLIYTLGN